MEEAGYKPGASLYDTRLDIKERQMRSQGASISRGEIKKYSFIDADINPDIRPGFGTYFGMPANVAFSQDPAAMEAIEKSPAISAMREGYESTVGSHGAQVSRTNALKHVPLVDEYDTGAKSAEVIKPKARRKPKPGDFLIDAEGRTTVVPPEPLNPRIAPDDLVRRASSAATGSPVVSGSSASMTSSVASTVSSGGAARVPAAVASTSPPVASAAARTAASVTAPTAARSTRSLMSNALEVGQKITRGHLGATALGVAAAGLLFGYANRDDD